MKESPSNSRLEMYAPRVTLRTRCARRSPRCVALRDVVVTQILCLGGVEGTAGVVHVAQLPSERHLK